MTFSSADFNPSCTKCASGKVALHGAKVCVACPPGRTSPYESEEMKSAMSLLQVKDPKAIEKLCSKCGVGLYQKGNKCTGGASSSDSVALSSW